MPIQGMLKMKELNMEEVQSVSGGTDPIQGFTWGGAIGTVAGAAATGSSVGATRAGIIGGALGFSFGVGYGIGTLIYDNLIK